MIKIAFICDTIACNKKEYVDFDYTYETFETSTYDLANSGWDFHIEDERVVGVKCPACSEKLLDNG